MGGREQQKQITKKRKRCQQGPQHREGGERGGGARAGRGGGERERGAGWRGERVGSDSGGEPGERCYSLHSKCSKEVKGEGHPLHGVHVYDAARGGL
jgi:hypothetical protein